MEIWNISMLIGAIATLSIPFIVIWIMRKQIRKTLEIRDRILRKLREEQGE